MGEIIEVRFTIKEDRLQTHLSGMVEALLSWQSSNKNHFKAKVKLLLEMPIKKCGIDAVKKVMPEDHMKRLTNMRKTNERNERKHGIATEENKSRLSKATTSRVPYQQHSQSRIETLW